MSDGERVMKTKSQRERRERFENCVTGRAWAK